MPAPATTTPAGSSQSAPRASDQRPKAGWISDELIVAARTRAPTIVYVRSKRIVRKGRSAGSEPWARSVARCPEERAAMPSGIDACEHAPNVTPHEEALRRGGLRGRGIRPRRGGAGLGERVKLRSRALSVSGRRRRTADPSNGAGHVFRAASDSIPPRSCRSTSSRRRREGSRPTSSPSPFATPWCSAGAAEGLDRLVEGRLARLSRRASSRGRGPRRPPARGRPPGRRPGRLRSASAARRSTPTGSAPRRRVAARTLEVGGTPSPGSSRRTASGRGGAGPAHRRRHRARPLRERTLEDRRTSARRDRAPRPLRPGRGAAPTRPPGARTWLPPGPTAAGTSSTRPPTS